MQLEDSRTKPKQQQPHLEGYLLIPHELLHVFGYWLVGKRCRYRWGQSYVTPLEPLARWQDLVGTLFPFTTFAILFLGCAVLSSFAYGHALHSHEYGWFIIWTGLAFIAGLYAGTAIGDLRNAYLVITQKPWYSRTPFDIFYWPVVDWEDVRKKVRRGEIDAQQD